MAPELHAQETQLTLSTSKRDNRKKKLEESFDWLLGQFCFVLLGWNAAYRKCILTSEHYEHCARELQQRAALLRFQVGVGGLCQSQWQHAVNDPKTHNIAGCQCVIKNKIQLSFIDKYVINTFYATPLKQRHEYLTGLRMERRRTYVIRALDEVCHVEDVDLYLSGQRGQCAARKPDHCLLSWVFRGTVNETPTDVLVSGFNPAMPAFTTFSRSHQGLTSVSNCLSGRNFCSLTDLYNMGGCSLHEKLFYLIVNTHVYCHLTC